MSKPFEFIQTLSNPATRTLMSLPFDLLRAQYAASVRAGLVQRSMLASSRFAHTLVALEQLAYGPCARKV